MELQVTTILREASATMTVEAVYWKAISDQMLHL
jgi:hypothetical protein